MKSCSARPAVVAGTEAATIKKGRALTGTEPPKTEARQRGKPIEVWVNDGGATLRLKRAEQSVLVRPGNLRAVTLNYPI